MCQYVAIRCSVLQCGILCCSVLQCVAANMVRHVCGCEACVCVSILQFVAVCCSVV